MAENSVSLKPSKHLSLSEKGMSVYAIAKNLKTKTQAVQVAAFITAKGPDAANIFNMFSPSEAETKNLCVIKTNLDT
ncbi:hypothetical protein PR048_020050 [Dryococelus australis]|uniref:Uncharacterized protein n=1 Tax=Dryococelus australis TaxID=614101 RepID=A0ABQ9H583_9NEOP|nr:hypothetical protein PR048_020050 [Dryococelus australis]